MCILLSVKHTWCSGSGTSALGICVFCYMSNLFGVVVFHSSMVNWRRGYICILLYLKVTWCSSTPYIYGQLEGDVNLHWVYVPSAIY